MSTPDLKPLDLSASGDFDGVTGRKSNRKSLLNKIDAVLESLSHNTLQTGDAVQ